MQKELVLLPMSARDLSHELRTPLVPIIGFAQELLETTLTSEQRSYINDILSAGEQLVRLANILSAEIKRIASTDPVNSDELNEIACHLLQKIQENDNTNKSKLHLFG